jgi:F-type H+-transporting ATPase subunit b
MTDHIVVAAAVENPLGFVPVEFALSLVTFGILFFLIWKFVAPRFEQTFAERTQAIEGGLSSACPPSVPVSVSA